ncbi:hypothetical protein Q4578_18790 [Shimia thalassica]|uniref:hypothetical protein n=1 Tax=Shimia thalassica TaxID=1715693 RepID=UPI0026E3C00B|nr:hypothetical protein [Shimia thalassica]MDO6523647.1 hypothetical protein [Shimia thalassica]
MLCLDQEPQSSVRARRESRGAESHYKLGRDPSRHALKATLDDGKAQFEKCIIDTPPARLGLLTEALSAADLVLINVPSTDDLRAVEVSIAAVNGIDVPLAFALSQTPRMRITKEAIRVLAQQGRVAQVIISQ